MRKVSDEVPDVAGRDLTPKARVPIGIVDPNNRPQIGDTLPSFDQLSRLRTQRQIDKLEREIKAIDIDVEMGQINLDHNRRDAQNAAAAASRHRTFLYTGPINDITVAYAIGEMGVWIRKEPGPITIVFNSPGGTVTDGLALFDFLRVASANGNPITTIGLGMVASMAAVLLQAGDKRILGRNAHLLIHEPSGGAIGKLSEIEDRDKFLNALQTKLVAILAERSTMSDKQIIARMKRTDWWLNADEAVKLGFADEVQVQ